MSNLSQSIRVALFFIFGVALIWIVHETLTESTLYSDFGYDLKAPFEDLRQLKNGADVRLAGVSIGAVKSTELRNGQAIAVLSIEENFRIPSDSVATITTAGLLGNYYVAIAPGDAKTYLKKGETIKTEETLSINDVVSKIGDIGEKISDLLDGFDTGDDGIGGAFGKLNQILGDNQSRIDNTFTNLETITDRLVDGQGTIGKLINEDEAYDKLLATATDIQDAAKKTSSFMDNASDIVDKVKDGEGTLGTLLTDDQIADNIRETVDNFHEFSEKLNSNDSTLGRLISDDELYTQAHTILNKVDNAVNNMENSGPITAVGVVAGALF